MNPIYPASLYDKLLCQARVEGHTPRAWHIWEGWRVVGLNNMMGLPVYFSQETQKAVVLETDLGVFREYIGTQEEA